MGRVRISQITGALKKFNRRPTERLSTHPYGRFDLLDGRHPWQEVMPEGFVPYPVRMLGEGTVAYFNFELAKEMGLIPKNHPSRMTKKLEKKIIETFSLRIVNEYDVENKVAYHPSVMKKHTYMATRYLQLQHDDKTGRTSGDGRCIWNGCVEYNGTMWDVSSRGTGVTRLAPGAVEAGKPLQSGSTEFGYGCGMADIDELVAGAIMAEIFHRQGLGTERVLAVVDLGKGNGIGVRAGKNLIRPAHLFMHLKQDNFDALKRSTDYLIARQFKNHEWAIDPQNPRRYSQLLDEICERFAQFTAQLDRDYIFAWLDWDGDNVLANAGIIDYGSIRQFGLRHDQYRYDDVDRFSTNLNEQKRKARQIVQVFAQLVDYLTSGKKKPINEFSSDPALEKYDNHFEYYLYDHFLKQIGLGRERREQLLKDKWADIKNLYQSFFGLETTKTHKGLVKVADGINRPAILNMRAGLVKLIEHYQQRRAKHKDFAPPEVADFFQHVLATSAKGPDRELKASLHSRIREFLKTYHSFMAPLVVGTAGPTLKAMVRQARRMNREDRITGDGLLHVVDKIINVWRYGRVDQHVMQRAIDEMIHEQTKGLTKADRSSSSRLHSGRRAASITHKLLSLVDGHKESI